MYVPAKVWTVCTDLTPGQGVRWPIVSHWQLTERPTNRFWTEITANFVQKCPIFGRGDSEGLVIEIKSMEVENRLGLMGKSKVATKVEAVRVF